LSTINHEENKCFINKCDKLLIYFGQITEKSQGKKTGEKARS